MRHLKTLLRKPPNVWLLAIRALILSGYYRYVILRRPFSEISPHIGILRKETSVLALDEKVIRDIQFAVIGVCEHTPWESKCLVQALTAKKILNEHGMPCTLYMGVRKNTQGELLAHAWLRCGNVYVTGGAGHIYNTVTAFYGDKE